MSIMTDKNQSNMYCGFYPSNNGDRKYGSQDFGRFLNGLICDGVFLTLYDQFKVSPTPNPGRSVVVGTGKAWFNGTWLELTDDYPIECEESYDDGDRYDAIVIAVNTTSSDFTYDGKTLPAYDTNIIAIKGDKSRGGTPVVQFTAGNQEVYKGAGVYLYPIADVYRGQNTTAITASDIRIRVGDAVCPYVQALITPSNDATKFTEMWRAQLDNFIDGLHADWEAEKENYDNDWNIYFTNKQKEMDTWFANRQAEYETWKNSVLDDTKNDTVGNLAVSTWEHEMKSYMLNGLPDGTKTVSEDGKTFTHTNDEYVLTKEFADDFMSYSITLTLINGTLIGHGNVSFDSSGNSSSDIALIPTV